MIQGLPELFVQRCACYTYAKFPDVCDTSKGCSACGHYTQLIWRETKNLGCAIATCGDSQL